MLPTSTLIYLTNSIFFVVESLVGIRIVLKLFNASQAAPFTRWVYDTTAPLLTPFQGMFPSPAVSGGLIIEFSALFALLMYAFANFLILEGLTNLERHTTSTSSRRRR